MLRFTLPLILCAPLAAAPLGYGNLPLGRTDKPLLLRTYVPDPGIPAEVLAHHDQASKSPKYSPNSGRDVKGEYLPIKGIPAAIAVNHGPALSYVFDTTECRLLYAWQGGFLDMFPYWGDPGRGSRQAFGYVPSLVGTVFHLASGDHPLALDGRSVADLGPPDFLGYDLDASGVPTFRFKFGGHEFSQRIEPVADESFSLRIVFRDETNGRLGYRALNRVTRTADALIVTIQGEALSKHSGYPRRVKFDKPSAEVGEKLFQNYGCIACHSTDGSAGHGPSLAGLFGRTRPVEGGETVTADESYIRQSIREPNARTAEGFPPNYMPPYPLKDKEVDALILFIRSLADS